MDAFVEQETFFGYESDWPNGGFYEDTASSYFLAAWPYDSVTLTSDDGSYSTYQLNYRLADTFNRPASSGVMEPLYFLLVRQHTIQEAYDAAFAGKDDQMYKIDNYGKIAPQGTGLELFRVFHSDNQKVDTGLNIHIPRG